jgi:hypothetical protein
MNLKEWHEEGRRKSNNHCEVCQRWFPDNMLCGHHCKSKKSRPDLKLDPTNRLMVCYQCHFKIHSGEIKINKKL